MREAPGFEELFPALLSHAARGARKVLRNSHDVEDVASETMRRVFVRWDDLEPDGRMRWAWTVARNLAIDHTRRRQPRVAESSASDSFEIEVVDRDELTQALAALPPRQREAVVLRHLAGFTEAHAARSLGLSRSTFKTHLARGVAALRLTLVTSEEKETTVAQSASSTSWIIDEQRHPVGELVDRRTVRFERRFPVPPSAVWNAIVGELGEEAPPWARWPSGHGGAALGAWLVPRPATLEPRVGGRFWFGSEEDDSLSGVVIDLDPERRIVLSFRNGSGIVFGVESAVNETRLVFTHWLPAGWDLSGSTNDSASEVDWNYQVGGPGGYQPGLAACWHGSLCALDEFLGGSWPEGVTGPIPNFPERVFGRYRESFDATEPTW